MYRLVPRAPTAQRPLEERFPGKRETFGKEMQVGVARAAEWMMFLLLLGQTYLGKQVLIYIYKALDGLQSFFWGVWQV